jgi:iron(III) transport system permease protein
MMIQQSHHRFYSSAVWERTKGRLDFKTVVLAAVVAILIWQVAVPLFMLVWGSLKTVSPGREGFWSFQFTFNNFRRAYTDPVFWSATKNSLVLAAGAAAFAFTGATFLAWVVERTNTPFRNLIFVLATARMILPGLLMTVAWVFLLSPRTGWINSLLMLLPWIDRPLFNVYSLGGMVWIMGVDLIPTSFILMSSALRSIDPSLEEAAGVAGSGPVRVFLRVTLPIMRPAAVAMLLLGFARGLEVFEVPALVGYPHGIDTYSTEIYYKTSTDPVDYGLTGAYAITLLAVSLVGVILYLRATRAGKRFMTVTGKGYRPRVIDLGAWRYVTAAAALTILVITIGLPLMVLVWNSLLPFPQPLSWQALELMSFKQYHYVLFTYPHTLLSFFNSTLVSTVSGLIIVLLVSVISWIVIKTKTRGRGLLDVLAFAPLAVPGLVLGLAFLWLYLAVPGGNLVYGTVWIIMLAMVTNWMPFGLRMVSVNMSQIHSELEEASYASGASWARTFRRIFLPLLSPGVVAAWIWVTVHSFRDVSTSLMLYTKENQTVGVQLFNIYERGSYNGVAALGVVLVVVLSILVVIAQQLSRRFGVRG